MVSGSYTPVDFGKIRIWKMSLGNTGKPEDNHIYPDCLSGGFVAHGSGRGLDFSKCQSKQDIEKVLAAKDWKNWPSTLDESVSQINAFKIKMQTGDLVIVSDGNDKFRAIGIVSGEYTYNPDFVYAQQRPVTWLQMFEESQPVELILKNKHFAMRTLYSLSHDNLKLDVLRDLLSKNEPYIKENYVLIIDEINRGNISKILGELITLLETDKRLGAKHELKVKLPYSQKEFGVPGNLYILGTMNTADKSIALVDIALRRRFAFEELMPDFSQCKSLTPEMKNTLSKLNERIVLRKDRDHQIGHSYFIDVHNSESFNGVFEKSIIPLLQEYFWNDWEGLRFVLGEESGESDKFILQIPNCEMRAARNKWHWFFDAKDTSPFDYLAGLQKNFFSKK